MRAGLLLGAGASFDFGLPLVGQVTKELKDWLTEGKLWSIEKTARARNDGYSDAVIQDVIGVMKREDMQYESILGYLQAQARRVGFPSSLKRSYQALYSWFSRLASEIILGQQSRNYLKLISIAPEYQKGFSVLVKENSPLWIFSLNYDLVIECIAAACDITLHCGFIGTQSLPRRDGAGVEIGGLEVEMINEEEIARGGPSFPNATSETINLAKLHGSLDCSPSVMEEIS